MSESDHLSDGLQMGLDWPASKSINIARRLAEQGSSPQPAVSESRLIILTPVRDEWLGKNVMTPDEARAHSLERMKRAVANKRPAAVLIESTFELHVLLRCETDATGLKAVDRLGLPGMTADPSSVENAFPPSLMDYESLTVLRSVATVREVQA